ncbi:hypothetical protein SDC9_93441 [bioreactor metagenome]|uniref:Uncharacterized protein n=1 Tax=bioreactor metagenome TaxID=1076179 RepID=A0A645A0M1_9ZZZZ
MRIRAYLTVSRSRILTVSLSHLRFVVIAAPRIQSPIFVIDKDSPISHRRNFQPFKVGLKLKHLPRCRFTIGPPLPWRNSHHAYKSHQPVGRSAFIATQHSQPVFIPHAQNLQQKPLVLSLQTIQTDALFGSPSCNFRIVDRSHHNPRLFQ